MLAAGRAVTENDYQEQEEEQQAGINTAAISIS
jgi:hypothetical protein